MDYAEAYDGYAAQGILRMDAEIVKKSHFWMETNWVLRGVHKSRRGFPHHQRPTLHQYLIKSRG